MLTVDEFRAVLKGPLSRWGRRALCPHCRAWLGGRGHVVVPTRHCPACGGRVLADLPDPEDDDPATRPTETRYKAAAERYGMVVGGIVMAGVAAWTLGACAFVPIFDRVGRWWPEPARMALGLWACAGPPALAIGIGYLWHRRAKRNPAITCPGCGEVLAGMTAVVGATGRCHACGRKFLAERPPDAPDLPPPAGPPLTVAEFVARRTARRRITRRVTVWFIVWAVLVAATAVSPFVVIGYDPIHRALAEEVGWGTAEGVITLTGMGLFVGLMAAGYVTAWAARPHLRRHPLTCPDCRQEFVQLGLVLAGRRCDHCHGLAVADPDSGTAGSAGPAGRLD